MNNTINELIKRKSTRAFSSKEITPETKEVLLNAIVNAPSAGNMQLYSIIDIDTPELKEKFAELCDHQAFIKDCKWALIFLADYHKWQNAFKNEGFNPRNIQEGDLLLSMEDAIIAAQNAVVAAESLGIGSCYIGDIMENAEEVIRILKLPKHVYPCCMLVFGYPHELIENVKKPERVNNKYVYFKNEYKEFDANELRDMLAYKANDRNLPYKEWLKKFFDFKHGSDFSNEMQRSAKIHIKNFID